MSKVDDGAPVDRTVIDTIDDLSRRNRAERDPLVEARLVELRCAGVPAHDPRPMPRAHAPAEQVSAAPGELAEIRAGDVTGASVSSAIQAGGSVIVRGLLDPTVAAHLRDGIEAAYEDRSAGRDDGPWYRPLSLPGDPGQIVTTGRRRIGDRALLAVDSPRVLFDMIEAYRAEGILDLVHGVLGEAPVLTVLKTTLRRVHASQFGGALGDPQIPGGWHQDGAFLGAEARTVNMWVALAPCGVRAPGLEVVGKRLDTVVDTGTASTWRTSIERVDEIAEGSIARPVFDTGDAIFFDHLTMHQTGFDPSMTETRYAIESWFFTAAGCPADRIPFVV